MEVKDYKRVPLLKNTKNRLEKAKIDSDCPTYDDFINSLLTEHESKDLTHDYYRFQLPGTWIHIHESKGRYYIGVNGMTWRDITDIVNDLKEKKEESK